MSLDSDYSPASLADLGPLAAPVSQRIRELAAAGFLERFYSRDASLWSSSPSGQAEASRRLGWMDSPQKAVARLPEYRRFAAEVHGIGIAKYLILGMGGSSLASEVIWNVFAGTPGTAERQLGILDSTDPTQVAQAARAFPPESTLYIVSSKSGGTAEVMAGFEYFWKLADGAGARFIAISDEGTSLQALGREKGFWKVFTADAAVGGRYSALTDFGMIPAALLGIDLNRFLDRAASMQNLCRTDTGTGINPGVMLGALLGEAAVQGRDKLTLLADQELATLPNWIEQLVAESSGKDGKGILPVALEPVDAPVVYGPDRLFVYLRQTGQLDSAVQALAHSGLPVLTIGLQDGYDVAAEFFRWEVAIATACHVIGVNAFDQPDVQESKDRTQAKIDVLYSGGSIDEGQWDVELAGRESVDKGWDRIRAFLGEAEVGDYIAINAYLPRQADVSAELRRLRVLFRERTHLATTVGFGPRFQHSTGQLHKGGRNNGLFVQIVCEPELELPIPGRAMTFGALIRAQALGDYETLLARGRRVVRVHLARPTDVALLRRYLDGPFT
jgi:glucose-6-phosphate isomerase